MAGRFLRLALMAVVASTGVAAPASAQTFSNVDGIVIPVGGCANPANRPASPYPSEIVVSGLTDPIADVDVTVEDVSHSFPKDLGLLLVGPTGVAVVVMREAGGGPEITDVDLTFDDAAAAPLPYNTAGSTPPPAPITSGSYQVSDLFTGDHCDDASFPAPAPAPNATALSAFNGTNANGTWKLFVIDSLSGDDGLIGAWHLEITTGTTPACDTGLSAVGCWRFGESSGTTALDSSGNGNHGTYVNGPTLGVPGAVAGDTAVAMDGVNDHVTVADSPSLDVGDSFTLEGWIKRDEDEHTHQLFNKGGKGFQLVVVDRYNGNQIWLRKAGSSTIVRTLGDGVPADGQFHHVVATKDGASTQIYVDGEAQPLQQVSPGQVIQNTSFPLFLSATATGNPVEGVLDEFAVYDGVLTPAQVQARFERGAIRETIRTAGTVRTAASPARGTAAADDGDGDGGCADLGRPDAGITAIRVAGLSCERAAGLMRGGPDRVQAAGLECAITAEKFSGPVVRITRECRGDNGRRLRYTTLS